MASISIVSTTSSSIKVRVTGLQTGYNHNDRVCTWYLDGKKKGTSKLGSNVSSGGDFTFSGLKSDTQYDIEVSIMGDSWNGWTTPVTISKSAWTDESETVSVEPWSWHKSNGSATRSQTEDAYDALVDRKGTAKFSYLVWNDMVDKVKEIRDAHKWTWNKSAPLSYQGTKMSSSNKILTADRFNSLRLNIGDKAATGINSVSKGDKVQAWYFTTLANKMNEMNEL